MRRIYWMFLLFSLLFLTGCIKSKEHLTVNQDGSGILEVNLVMKKAVLTTLDSIMESMFAGMQQAFGGGQDSMPAMPDMSETIFSKEEIEKEAEEAGLIIQFLDYKREIRDEDLYVDYKLQFDSIDKLISSNMVGTKIRLTEDSQGNAVCYFEGNPQKMQESRMQMQQFKGWKESEKFQEFKSKHPGLAESLTEALESFQLEFLITMQGQQIKQVGGMFSQTSLDTASVSFGGNILEDAEVLEKLYKGSQEESKVVWHGQYRKPLQQESVLQPEQPQKAQAASEVKLYLKNGQVITGKLLEQTEDYLRVERSGVGITYFKDDIESIED